MKKKIGQITTWFLCFVTFGMIGWVYEAAVMYFEMHMGFVNRGFLWGPCLPIYGLGGLLIVCLLGGLQKKKILVGKINFMPLVCFLVIGMLATMVELGASYLLERWIGKVLWDYRGAGFGPTFEGRIALWSSVRFGLIGTIVLYGIYPLLSKGFSKWQEKWPKIYFPCAFLIFFLFLADLIWHVIHGSNANW